MRWAHRGSMIQGCPRDRRTCNTDAPRAPLPSLLESPLSSIYLLRDHPAARQSGAWLTCEPPLGAVAWGRIPLKSATCGREALWFALPGAHPGLVIDPPSHTP